MNIKQIKKEIVNKLKNNPGITWESDDLTFYAKKELYLMYFFGNLDLSKKLGTLKGKVKKQIINNIHNNVVGDLEMLYNMCVRHEHPNGRDIDWLESEGLIVK
jgi:hypothetical protein